MADIEKKMAAALAAVGAYIQEEEAIHQHEALAAAAQPPPQQFSMWGYSGRHDMMSMRQLIQMKAFSRF